MVERTRKPSPISTQKAVFTVNAMTNSDNSQLWKTSYLIPSDPDEAHVITDMVVQVLNDFGWSHKEVFAIHLALEEALINAVCHGNDSKPELKVDVQLEITPARFYVQITDEGPGFDPNKLPDPTLDEFIDRPCGRGVMLIRKFMDTVQYNERGNQITLIKNRCPAEGG